MNSFRTRIAGLAAMCLFAAGCDVPDSPEANKPVEPKAEAPPPPQQGPAEPKPRLISFAPATLPGESGHVTAIANDAITIRTLARKDLVTFPFHDALAAGGVQKYGSGSTGYRVQDVQVGDEVCLNICTEGKLKFCAEIQIRKRPGGRVPEAFVDSLKPTYADRKNAENDLADFGIPIPERFNKRRPIIKHNKERDEELNKVFADLEAKREAEEREKGKQPPPPKKNEE